MTTAGAQRAGLFALVAAMIVAVILRVMLSDYSLWFDEYASVFFASQPFGRLWSAWMVRETNPPLFYSILRAWTMLPGTLDGFWLRVPSIVASVLAIPVAYFGTIRHYGPKGAVAAAIMLAVSAQQIFYAHQVRAYSFLFLALAISFFGILRIAASIENKDRVPLHAWLAYVLGSVVAIYLHTTAIFWPAIATLSLMIVVPQLRPIVGRLWLQLAFADLVILLCASWWLYISFVQVWRPNENISWLRYRGLRQSLQAFWYSAALLRDSTGWQELTTAGLGALAITGIVRTRKMIATRLTAICWAVAIVSYVIVSHKQSIIVERTIVWMAIFPITLVAAASGTFRSSLHYLIITSIVITLMLINLTISYPFELENWRDAVATVSRDKMGALMVSGEGDALVAAEACIVQLHRPACPFPVVTLENPARSVWALGFSPKTRTKQGKVLDLPLHTRFYFIQRWSEQPLEDLRTAGVVKASNGKGAFFVGPYFELMPDLQSRSHVRDGVLILSASPN